MTGAYALSTHESVTGIMPPAVQFAAPIFAFGLVAFGFLSMGPVTIAVDSFGPVTDNAQSVYELSRIESRPGIAEEITRGFGFKPDFENGKYQLEKGDGAGNTVHGLSVAADAAGNIVFSDDPDHLVALVGVRDSVVVHTADVTMVCPVADAERVKQLLAEVEQRYGPRFS